jgi:hypothetical protein
MNIIATRQDLDAIQGTPEHDQFMSVLSGSIYRAQKDEASKSWVHAKDLSMIETFGFTEKDFPNAPKPALPEWIEEKKDPKLVGVEFEGVMCSATRDDQNGLMAVLMAHQLQGTSFQPTEFQFSNGYKLLITKENIKALIGEWMPFRQSFFAPDQE